MVVVLVRHRRTMCNYHVYTHHHQVDMFVQDTPCRRTTTLIMLSHSSNTSVRIRTTGRKANPFLNIPSIPPRSKKVPIYCAYDICRLSIERVDIYKAHMPKAQNIKRGLTIWAIYVISFSFDKLNVLVKNTRLVI